MNNFIEVPASKTSLSGRKRVLGVAINDADYMVSIKVNGKWVQCPFYLRWSNMLKRCYYERYRKSNSSYKGCTVSKEWLLFSNFKAWMEEQEWEGNHLDKDILVHNNKHYSKETRLFVSPNINSLMLNSLSSRGAYPQGVSLSQGKYQSYCNKDGGRVCLGTFNTPEEASATYRKFKYNLIIKTASQQGDILLRNALLIHAEIFKSES